MTSLTFCSHVLSNGAPTPAVSQLSHTGFMRLQDVHRTDSPSLELLSLSISHPDAAPHQDAFEPHFRPSSVSGVSSPREGHTKYTNHGPVVPSQPASFVARLWQSIMSRTPLLRSSPALGTSSYGALPVQSSYSSSEDEDERDERTPVHADVSRIQSEHGVANDHGSQSNPRQRVPSRQWQRRRSSSLGNEILMGPDSKTSFGHAPPISEDKAAESSASSQRSRRESEEPNLYVATADDPPDNSQYPEVRASVPATDNAAASINTPRMWLLSLLFAIAGSATNLFFSLRYPSVAITPVIALVLVHPLGKLWDLLLKHKDDPDQSYDNGDPQDTTLYTTSPSHSRRFRLWLAQGSWNEKEHACVYISSNVSFGFAFATDVIVEQHMFYKQDAPIIYQILLTISTQILGYAFAGLTRRYLVRPAAMIWPGTLMSTAMFTTMHKNENKSANGWTISRYKFFIFVWTAAFAWYFLPGLLMPALSYFNVITWFAPRNVVVSNLVGATFYMCVRS